MSRPVREPPPSGCVGPGTPALRHTAAPIVCSGPRASCTGQPLGLVQSGSDDRRHRRFGTLLVIDDHYVSLVHAVALSLRASRSGWPDRPLSSQHRLTSLERRRSPCSAPQRLILGRPHHGWPGPSPHWTTPRRNPSMPSPSHLLHLWLERALSEQKSQSAWVLGTSFSRAAIHPDVTVLAWG